ncbi:TPA: hypothetical protein ACU9Z3_004870 [Citrobacter freundii]
MFKLFREKLVKKKESTQKIRPYILHPDINSNNADERSEAMIGALSNPLNPLGIAFVIDELTDNNCMANVSDFLSDFNVFSEIELDINPQVNDNNDVALDCDIE